MYVPRGTSRDGSSEFRGHSSAHSTSYSRMTAQLSTPSAARTCPTHGGRSRAATTPQPRARWNPPHSRTSSGCARKPFLSICNWASMLAYPSSLPHLVHLSRCDLGRRANVLGSPLRPSLTSTRPATFHVERATHFHGLFANRTCPIVGSFPLPPGPARPSAQVPRGTPMP